MVKKKRVKVDLRGWEFGDWKESMEDLVKEIAEEAIEAFFNSDELLVFIDRDGIRFDAEAGVNGIVPLSRVVLSGDSKQAIRRSAEAIKRTLDAELERRLKEF